MPSPLHGGWWQGAIDDRIYDAICRQRCIEAHVAVIAVGYRLAPEYPFPTGLNDAYATLGWLMKHAARLHIDADNISVGGSSAQGEVECGNPSSWNEIWGPPASRASTWP
jgi:acetyl esterase/lipase